MSEEFKYPAGLKKFTCDKGHSVFQRVDDVNADNPWDGKCRWCEQEAKFRRKHVVVMTLLWLLMGGFMLMDWPDVQAGSCVGLYMMTGMLVSTVQDWKWEVRHFYIWPWEALNKFRSQGKPERDK